MHRRTAFVCAALLALSCVTWSSVAPARPSTPAERPHAASYQRYAVAAGEGRAAQLAANMLEAGGSAADAVAAAMLALNVTSPTSSGLGGGGFALYYDASQDELTFLDFRERAAEAASADMFVKAKNEGVEDPSRVGGLATGVPGEPAGIQALLHRFGKLPRREVVSPVARMAEEGVRVNAHVARLSRYFADDLRNDPVFSAWLAEGEQSLKEGQIVKNPALAKTLRVFAEHGAEPFYRGAIAREIVRVNRAHGGQLSEADLARYGVVEREPLQGHHFGYRWTTAPPPSAGGYTLLMSLAQLEYWLPFRGGVPRAQQLHAYGESFKGPFLDRPRYFGDPDHVEVPLTRLRARERIARRARIYHETLAQPAARYALPLEEGGEPATPVDDHGTSHLCVVDAEGDVAAVTTTINLPFGARYTAAGMFMNDEMDDFAKAVGARNAFGLKGGAANLPAPGKRPVSTMSPTIVFDGEGPVLCIGASGGSRIVTAITQVAHRVLAEGTDPREAVEQPRVHHQGTPDVLRHEPGLDEATLRRLQARGHRVEEQKYGANVQLIRIRNEAPRLRAVSDPRKGGAPAGK